MSACNFSIEAVSIDQFVLECALKILSSVASPVANSVILPSYYSILSEIARISGTRMKLR